MRWSLALAALVAVASALPSALTTREDFVEDDFEIQAEPDDNARRSVGWPEVSLQAVENPSIFLPLFLVDSFYLFVHSSNPIIRQCPMKFFCSIYISKWPLICF